MLEGIPILVRDPAAHEQALAAARKHNPLWYEKRQPPESESPYRLRLAQRRAFWQSSIRNDLGRKNQEKAPRILDLGCGDGNNLPGLLPFCDDLYASDYNIVRLVRAKHAYPGAEVFLADIMDYPAPDDCFDIVFCNHVLEHIPEDAHALATMRRILKPGGLLVLGIPNEGAWWWRLAYRLQPKERENTDHVHFYTARMIRRRLCDAGLCVQTVRGMGWGPPHWDWDLRLATRPGWHRFFEAVGPVLLPGQASALYALASKPKEKES